MYVRLAFAVAAHLEPEILIIDEVFSVGDAAFQKKCLGKMGEVANLGRTVLFVSHNMGVLTKLCERSLWIDGGITVFDGTSIDAAHRYQSYGSMACAEWRRSSEKKSRNEVSFDSVRVVNSTGELTSNFDGNESVFIKIAYSINRPLSECQIGSRILNSEGEVVFSTSDGDHCYTSALPRSPGVYKTCFAITPGFLVPGRYSVYLAAHLPQRAIYDLIDQTVSFDISPSHSLVSLDGRLGVVTPLILWKTE